MTAEKSRSAAPCSAAWSSHRRTLCAVLSGTPERTAASTARRMSLAASESLKFGG